MASGHLAARTRGSAGALGPVVQLSTAGQDAFHTALETRKQNVMMRGDGTAAATWSAFDGDDYRVYVAQMDAAGTWSSPMALSVSGQNATLPSLTLGQSGSLAVAWQRSDGIHSRIQVSKYEGGSAQWSLPVTLSKAGQSAFWPTVTWDGAGVYSATWARSNGSQYRLESKRVTPSP